MFNLKLLSCVGVAAAQTAMATEFHAPTLLQAGDKPIATEAPGYASPCWADMDGDGTKDLLVGQFNGGKINIYKGLKDGKLAPGKWLKVNGKVVEVPGVW